MTLYDFAERVRFSEGVSDCSMEQIIEWALRDVTAVWRAEIEDDKHGVDYWARLQSGDVVGIDVKTRSRDRGDTLVEMFSRLEHGVAGWTIDRAKITDYVLYYYRDTKRWVVYPFGLLREATIANMETWLQRFRLPDAESIGLGGRRWHTRNCGVPDDEIWRAIRAVSQGIAA